MIVNNTDFKEVILFTPTVYHDSRGYFFESYNSKITDIIGVEFPQDNHSSSKKNVLRGLHYQWAAPMGKLVRVVRGRGYDVVVDIRKKSTTYGKWAKFLLTEDNFNILWIPPGFAHGFLSLEDQTTLVYKTSALHNKQTEGAINPLCKDLGIDWGVSHQNIILSEKDKQAQLFSDYLKDPKF